MNCQRENPGAAPEIRIRSKRADKWSGQVYSPEEGKVFSGNLTLQGANALRLEGCCSAA